MALNFQQVFQKIREIGSGARARLERLEEQRQRAVEVLGSWADKTDELNKKVERALHSDPNLRCALPLADRLDFHCQPENTSIDGVTIIAADGSQIVPDRHAPVLFGLINVGAIVISDTFAAPQVLTDSQLSFEEEVDDWTEAFIALNRDLAERKKLLAIAKDYPAPVVTLTDGGLQLWEARGDSEDMKEFKKELENYLSVLSQLQEQGTITAGYVDKPASNLLVRLLEVAMTVEPELKDIHTRHPLQGVSDLWLFDRLLQPGERSAVFALQGRSKATYTGSLSLHFFYMNAGTPGHPKTVRVEIPAWVSSEKAQVDLLQCALLDQCAAMGARPYPYILHRAHEAAVVTLTEKQQLEQLLQIELRRAGGEVGEASGKQSAKDLAGRSSYR